VAARVAEFTGLAPENDEDISEGTTSDYLFFQSAVERSDGNTLTHCSFAYSALAAIRMGMSGSASFQRVRKSL